MKCPTNATELTATRPVPTPEACLAKTWKSEGTARPGRNVESHCRIAAAVAARLADVYTTVCPGIIPAGTELLALVHDIGKLCPTFAAKIYDAFLGEKGRCALPWLASADPSLEILWGGHAAVSYAALLAWGAPEAVARVAGGHHGRGFVKHEASRPDYGGEPWQALRRSLLDTLLGSSPAWPDLTDKPHLERLVTGLTIVADWIASGALFDDPGEDWQPLVSQAVEAAG